MSTYRVRLFFACLLTSAALPATLQAAQGDICEKMSGEQLRRCIEASSREPAAQPPRSPAAAGQGVVAPAPVRQAVNPSAPSASAAQTGEPKQLQRRDCTKVPQPDQALCVYRNTALLECGNRSKYLDRDKCLADLMSRAPNPALADCAKLPQVQQGLCLRRNKVYASCKGDKLGYFACLDTRLASEK